MYQVQEPLPSFCSRNPPLTQGPPAACARVRAAQGLPDPFSCGLLGRFVHEVDRCTSCPGTDRQLDLLAQLCLKRLRIWHGDGLHFDKAAVVFGFDLEDFTEGDDFTRFFVGSATKSGSCTEGADEDEHGFSLSG